MRCSLICSLGRGRRSVAPRTVATVMVLQRWFGLSDREAVAAFEFDVRWRYACGGLALDSGGFCHPVLVGMRARLAASQSPRRIFDVVLDAARARGRCLRGGCWTPRRSMTRWPLRTLSRCCAARSPAPRGFACRSAPAAAATATPASARPATVASSTMLPPRRCVINHPKADTIPESSHTHQPSRQPAPTVEPTNPSVDSGLVDYHEPPAVLCHIGAQLPEVRSARARRRRTS